MTDTTRPTTQRQPAPDAPSDGFITFVYENEAPLRRALVARLGRDRGGIATGEALSWAWENWAHVRTIDRPIPYLVKVGASRTRLRRRHPELDPPATSAIPDFEPGLDAALEALTQRQRGSVVLIAGLGYSYAEAAELLGVRKSTVQRHYERGLAKLRHTLGAPMEAPHE